MKKVAKENFLQNLPILQLSKNQGNVNQHISLVETLVGVVSFSLKTQVYKGIAQNIRHLERTHQSPQRREDKAGNKKIKYI